MIENNSRVASSNSKSFLETKLTDLILKENINSNQSFYFGDVIDSVDDENGNRLRVRIPILDDVFYYDDQGNMQEKIGDDLLPWCVPFDSRFIHTPENGSVVLVVLFNPDTPFLGRMWFAPFSGNSQNNEIFNVERLKEEVVNKRAWELAEKNSGVRYNFSPTNSNRKEVDTKKKKINYKIGIRGKSKNKLLFDEKSTTLVQNENDSNESKIVLDEKAKITSKEIDILSTNSKKKENPVFAKPMFQYETKLLTIIQAILTTLSSVPALSTGPACLVPSSPLTPNPAFNTILSQVIQLKSELEKLKLPGNGSSKYITIN